MFLQQGASNIFAVLNSRMPQQEIGTEHWSIQDLVQLLSQNLQLSDPAKKNIQACRSFLDAKMKDGKTYYGINTGFGSLCNVTISANDIEQLQENLVLSHACGLGDEVPQDIVRIMLLLKIKNFTYGHSGVSLPLVERLMAFYNSRITPVVYQLGSLGASGDLAPLAHLSLPLLNKGEVYIDGIKRAGSELSYTPLKLQSKEGLALLNGTQFMSSYAVYCVHHIQRLMAWADGIAAISFDAFDATPEPFYAPIHTVRNHTGQQEVAKRMLAWLAGSEISEGKKTQVQDPYSFRCIPQVHGATRDAMDHVIRIIEQEINAVTDNPLVFPEQDRIVSGGNFHGQPLAINLDYAAIAVAELANISERRTYLLISGQRGLPPFLTEGAGLDSGFMIAQYTAASIVSKNKQLCTPASVDSIVSSNGQEDHVSMGANAATKLLEVVRNTEMVLAIELMNAVQALECRRPNTTSPQLEQLILAYRKVVPRLTTDRVLHDDMKKSISFIQEYPLPI